MITIAARFPSFSPTDIRFWAPERTILATGTPPPDVRGAMRLAPRLDGEAATEQSLIAQLREGQESE